MQTLVQATESFLDSIISPAAIKQLSADEMQSLAHEIRQEVIGNLSRTGGQRFKFDGGAILFEPES